jgi:hypothetical protein
MVRLPVVAENQEEIVDELKQALPEGRAQALSEGTIDERRAP